MKVIKKFGLDSSTTVFYIGMTDVLDKLKFELVGIQLHFIHVCDERCGVLVMRIGRCHVLQLNAKQSIKEYVRTLVQINIGKQRVKTLCK